jgi:hypothetical protein
MAMTYATGKNTYITMRELGEWIRSLKLPNIHFMNNPMTDELTIINTHNKNSQRITRYALEDAVNPHEVILEAISNIMAVPIDKLGDIIREAANPKPMTYTTDSTADQWVANPNGSITRSSPGVTIGIGGSGGSGGMWGGGSGGVVNTLKTFTDYAHGGHVGYVPLNDEEIMIRDKTFGPYERALITTAKERLKQKYWMYIPSELMYSKHIVIAGGCWTSLFHGETPRDIDVFILNDKKAKGMLHTHIQQVKFKNPSSEIIKEGSSNYMDNDSIEYTAFDTITKLQFITTKYPTRQKLVEHFDMVHCCVSYTPWDDKLYISRDVYDTIMKKEIRSNQKGIMELVKPYRITRMQERGWKVARNVYT